MWKRLLLLVAVAGPGNAHRADKKTNRILRRQVGARRRHRLQNTSIPAASGTNTSNENVATSSPCNVPKTDAVLPTKGFMMDFLKLSYYEDCLAALSVDTDLMLAHIESLRTTFEQYFCFYTIANDVFDTDPISYEPQLGYTLFHGPDEGQVNLDKELVQLEQRVTRDGASLGTFWEIQTIFNKLYDAHVDLPALTGIASVTRDVLVFVFPERNLNAETAKIVEFSFSYDHDGELRLAAIWSELDGSGEPQRELVVNLNGKTPYEFFYELANNPNNYNPYQSRGARMNNLFKTNPDISPFRYLGGTQPSNYLPQSFSVKYENGQEELYHTGISYVGGGISFEGTNYSNTTAIYDLLTHEPKLIVPGSAYVNYLVATFQVADATTSPPPMAASLENKTEGTPNPSTIRTRQIGDAKFYDWDVVYNLPDQFSNSRIDAAAFKIEHDYAVFKIQDFSITYNDEGLFAIVEIWSNFTASAKARGIKKAIVDISGNNGGSVESGHALAASMFPFLPKEVLFLNYDMNYNKPMMVYKHIVSPIIDGLEFNLMNNTDTILQEYMDGLPKNYTDVLFRLVLALSNFCCGGRVEDICLIEQPRCQGLFDLRASVESLKEFPVAPQFRMTIVDLIEAFQEYNPFNVLDAEGIDPDFVASVVRGGVLTNLTNRFSVFTDELYYYTVARALLNDWSFDEYVIVSDGIAGSTTCIFSAIAVQLRNNDVGVRANLTTVTYGGSKVSNETTLAGFPASVQGVKIEFPLITSGLLYMLQYLLPSELSGSLEAINTNYQSVLPVPPYFADSLPAMPVYNYYSRLMDPGAVPLQYIKISADVHIRQVYSKNSIYNSDDLAPLYKETARLGFKATSLHNEVAREQASLNKTEVPIEDGSLLPLVEASEDEGFHG